MTKFVNITNIIISIDVLNSINSIIVANLINLKSKSIYQYLNVINKYLVL